jgi:hypothetical protein
MRSVGATLPPPAHLRRRGWVGVAADLKAENKSLERALAAAHGEVHRCAAAATREHRPAVNVGDTVTDNAVPDDETEPRTHVGNTSYIPLDPLQISQAGARWMWTSLSRAKLPCSRVRQDQADRARVTVRCSPARRRQPRREQ